MALQGGRWWGRHGPRDQHEAVTDDGPELSRRRVRVRAEVLDARRRSGERLALRIDRDRPTGPSRRRRAARVAGPPSASRATPTRRRTRRPAAGTMLGLARVRGPGRRRDGRGGCQAIVALAARQRPRRRRRRLPRKWRGGRRPDASPRPVVLHDRSSSIGRERAASRASTETTRPSRHTNSSYKHLDRGARRRSASTPSRDEFRVDIGIRVAGEAAPSTSRSDSRRPFPCPRRTSWPAAARGHLRVDALLFAIIRTVVGAAARGDGAVTLLLDASPHSPLLRPACYLSGLRSTSSRPRV